MVERRPTTSNKSPADLERGGAADLHPDAVGGDIDPEQSGRSHQTAQADHADHADLHAGAVGKDLGDGGDCAFGGNTSFRSVVPGPSNRPLRQRGHVQEDASFNSLVA